MITFLGGEQGSGEGLGKARGVEMDAERVWRAIARRPGILGVTDAGVAYEDAEGWGVVMGPVIVGDAPDLGVDGERADVAGIRGGADRTNILPETPCLNTSDVTGTGICRSAVQYRPGETRRAKTSPYSLCMFAGVFPAAADSGVLLRTEERTHGFGPFGPDIGTSPATHRNCRSFAIAPFYTPRVYTKTKPLRSALGACPPARRCRRPRPSG